MSLNFDIRGTQVITKKAHTTYPNQRDIKERLTI